MIPALQIADEFSLNSPDRDFMCGQCCVSALLQAFGKNVTPLEVNDWIVRTQGLLPTLGTTAFQLQAALTHWGVPSTYPRTYQGLMTFDGWRIREVQSDGLGNPVPKGTSPIRHWIITTDQAPTMDTVYNPGGGRTYQLSKTVIEEAELGPYLSVSYKSPKKENPMPAIPDIHVASAIVTTTYLACGANLASFIAPGTAGPGHPPAMSGRDVQVAAVLAGTPIDTVVDNIAMELKRG